MNAEGGPQPDAPVTRRERPGVRYLFHTLLEHGAPGATAARIVNGALILLILVNVAAAVLVSVPELAFRY